MNDRRAGTDISMACGENEILLEQEEAEDGERQRRRLQTYCRRLSGTKSNEKKYNSEKDGNIKKL